MIPAREWFRLRSQISGGSHCSVIVAVPLVRVMQVAFYQIVGMAAVRNRLMPTLRAMRMLLIVGVTRVARSAVCRIRATLRQSVFINVPLMVVVQVALMQIVDVTFMFDCNVSAT